MISYFLFLNLERKQLETKLCMGTFKSLRDVERPEYPNLRQIHCIMNFQFLLIMYMK